MNGTARHASAASWIALVLALCVLTTCAEPDTSSPPPPCQSDAACPTGMVCRAGQCAMPGVPADGGSAIDGGVARDGGSALDAGTIIDGGVVADGGMDDGGPADDGGDAGPTGAPFGAHCSNDNDCQSQICLQTPSGSICTHTCSNDCPVDYACKSFVFENNRLVSLCIPFGDVYCQPCSGSSDCLRPEDRCTNVGGANYCTRDCSQSGACPPGYDCQMVNLAQTAEGSALLDAGVLDGGVGDDGGATFSQCLPQGGLCPGCIDADGDRYGVGADCLGPDCDDTDPNIHPGAMEICDGKDNNCNGQIDEGFDLRSDDRNCGACNNVCPQGRHCCNGACVDTSTAPDNCGGCGNVCNGTGVTCCGGACHDTLTEPGYCGGCGTACTNAHGMVSCDQGLCRPSCTSGFGDCDGDPRNGCETPLDTVANCGACGHVCTNGNGTTSCVQGHCVPSCNPGYSDCDGNPDNGCETSTNTSQTNCGGCGVQCTLANASAMCAGGNCLLAGCNSGFKNCDGLVSTGCETDINNDSQNCGACNRQCTNPGGPTHCEMGECHFTCSPGYFDCNGDPTDGCEANLSQVTVCNACMTDMDCPPDFYCRQVQGQGICTKKGPLGNSCMDARECLSNHCVDGVCCNSDCTGLCSSCALSGSMGTCSFIPADQDPDHECAPEAMSTCGQNGACDGAGGCKLWPKDTLCSAESCTAGVQTNPSYCDGMGHCNQISPASVRCEPYVCNGPMCGTSCSLMPAADGGVDGGADGGSAQCAPGYDCVAVTVDGGSAAGVCKATGGQPCADATSCFMPHCVDGVCCDTACDGVCMKCNLAGHVGNCTAVPGGTDPDNECATQDVSTCGTTGVCSGDGGCALYPSGSVCNPQSCTGSTQTNAKTCDGLGTCTTPTPSSVDCSPYVCNSAVQSCFTTCANDNQCIANYGCRADGKCKKVNGQPCNPAGDECKSGYCVDGVCCESQCNGACEKCNYAGRLGFCDPVPAGQVDPDTACPMQNVSTCGTTGLCSGSRSCSKYAAGTVCVGAFCSADLSTSNRPDTCDGLGTCVDNGTQNCFPYKCSTTNGLCKTSCSSTADCVANYSCKTSAGPGQFQCLKNDGQSCSSNSECLNNACCSGICRNTATDLNNCGQCGSICNLANASDTCFNGVCTLLSCNSGWGNCDSNSSNGCETSLHTTSNCGSCGNVCNLPNASATCPSGNCQVSSCYFGWANCDGNDANGCETHLQNCGNPGTCCSNTNLGSVQGDNSGCNQYGSAQTGLGETCFTVTVTENDSCCNTTAAQFILGVPAGVDYDLYVSGLPSDAVCQYWNGSSWVTGCAGTRSAGLLEAVRVYRTEGCTCAVCCGLFDCNCGDGSDQTFTANIEIRYYSGLTCTPWSFYVYSGNGC
jgi:hypothetical protein